MIHFVRTFAEGVKQRRRFELSIVFVLGLLGFAMSGTGPDPNFKAFAGPSHTTSQETTRAVRVVIVAARAVPRSRVIARRVARPRRDARPSPPAPAPVPSGLVARLPARVRGPPSPTVCA